MDNKAVVLKTKDEIQRESDNKKRKIKTESKHFFNDLQMIENSMRVPEAGLIIRKLQDEKSDRTFEKPEEYKRIYDLYLAKLIISDILIEPLYSDVAKKIDIDISINIIRKKGDKVYSLEDTLLKYIQTILQMKKEELDESIVDFSLIISSSEKILENNELSQYLFGILASIACRKSQALALMGIGFVNDLTSILMKIRLNQFFYDNKAYSSLLIDILTFYKAIYLYQIFEVESSLKHLEQIKHNKNVKFNDKFFLSGSSGKTIKEFYKEIYHEQYGYFKLM